jgi:metal-responsive CopG/Arc/MetJ family transcriptional regulator
MAKVMISLPDDLLERIDAFAKRTGTTRSGLLRELAEQKLAGDADERQRAIGELLAKARPHGGDNVRFIREMRRSR